MQRHKLNVVAFLVILIILTTIGCSPQERPMPQENNTAPRVPEEISQGEGKEPRLKVYLIDTGEIKEMAFEEYVAGVLAGEMHNDWPQEALAAQAILARTFVMEFVTDKGGSKYEGAHVSTDIEEAQAWDARRVNERIKEAVNRTRGMVAVHNNKYIKAWFHAHAGGKTSAAKEGLGYEEAEPPYVKIVESPDSELAPPDDANWSETFTKQEIIQAVKEQGKEVSDFNSIEIAETGPSGRATVLQVGDTTVEAPAFRIALDSTRMKSTMIKNISVNGNQVTIEGAGYGHGVGMSQWGAYQMANDGKNAEEIVKYYFKDIEIIKLWE
ncbi:SpoIID/LytB domain-containing protein [Alkaliphilus pronyensis]|uniref:SpoIID/LytB domain-containing protein n=1 Tax=Alkaliphilus pronyensis TaxID=1482732 RepID=A0A6I0EZ80_9FIRM|nr:SpoIID/LytB domain-containing protein [Alkaliphilus pronyensis]KAB3531892.1 SpoIID/LytB domain-containing protein [Alkaliphilus pronyensis]